MSILRIIIGVLTGIFIISATFYLFVLSGTFGPLGKPGYYWGAGITKADVIGILSVWVSIFSGFLDLVFIVIYQVKKKWFSK